MWYEKVYCKKVPAYSLVWCKSENITTLMLTCQDKDFVDLF